MIFDEKWYFLKFKFWVKSSELKVSMQNQDRLTLWSHFGYLPYIYGFCNFGKSKRIYVNVQFFWQKKASYPGSQEPGVDFFKPRSRGVTSADPWNMLQGSGTDYVRMTMFDEETL